MESADVEIADFDFDRWMRLAQQSPADFEAFRRAEIGRVLDNTNNRNRLMGLQFRIDAERVRAHTPLKACLRLSTLMWDKFLGLNAELNELAVCLPRLSVAMPDKLCAVSAEIIRFDRGRTYTAPTHRRPEQ